MKTCLKLAALTAAMLLAQGAAAQARSNIADDPRSSNCTENCIDAGYEWAIANEPAGDADCAAQNEDFAAGCAHWVQEQIDLSAPPLEDPGELPMPADSEPMTPADEPMPADAPEPPEAQDGSSE